MFPMFKISILCINEVLAQKFSTLNQDLMEQFLRKLGTLTNHYLLTGKFQKENSKIDSHLNILIFYILLRPKIIG